MLNLLKTFGKGILYVIGLPFFLVALLLFAIFGLLAFLFQLIKSIIFFFTGQKFFPELPEDKELRLLKEGPVVTNSPETPTAQPAQEAQPIIVPLSDQVEQNNEQEISQGPTIEEACFNQQPEQPIEEEEEVEQSPLQDLLDEQPEEDAKEEEIIEDEPEIEEEETTVLETSESKDEKEEEKEQLDTYFPRSSNYDNQYDDDDDDSDGGVDIESV